MSHPFSNVAIVGDYITKQSRMLEGQDSLGLTLEAIKGALNDAGITKDDVDGVGCEAGMAIVQARSAQFAHMMGFQANWLSPGPYAGPPGIIAAGMAIEAGLCHTVVLAGAQAGEYRREKGTGGGTAPWTRPSTEFMEYAGMHTPVEFALPAIRHMKTYGTTPEQLAEVSSTIRNNGHINPNAVYAGRGPFTQSDILNSPMISEPFHLLDCAMTSEGGSAMVLTTVERAKSMRKKPIYVLGAGTESAGPGYTIPAIWDECGYVGRRAAEKAFKMSGLSPSDIDVCEFYDPFSFEIIRQFEAYGFCDEGEGGPYIETGVIKREGKHPICTDGGLMSNSHPGNNQHTIKAVSGIRQLRKECGPRQIDNPSTAMVTFGGSGALFMQLVILGTERP